MVNKKVVKQKSLSKILWVVVAYELITLAKQSLVQARLVVTDLFLFDLCL